MKHASNPERCLKALATVALAVCIGLLGLLGPGGKASAATAKVAAPTVKGKPITSLLSTGGLAARQALRRNGTTANVRARAMVTADEGDEDGGGGLIPPGELGISNSQMPSDPGPGSANGNGSGSRNVFVNDPCLDPPPTAPFPTNFMRTVQSETDIAALSHVDNAEGDDENDKRNQDGDDESAVSGKLMVAGYNDSYGFYNNTQGLSGYSYSTNGGKSWIDGSGLPPIVKSGAPAGTAGSDAYFGDPVVTVHHRSRTFYYASIYLTEGGVFTLAVNRGHFKVAPPQGIESKANTRCGTDPAKYGIPDPPAYLRKRVIWEPPVVAVPIFDPGDFIDKEWMYVDQKSGELYVAYVRFAGDGSTPLELVRSFDGGHTWTPPSIIVPNLDDTFNTSVQPITTVNGRVIVSWFARTFALVPPTFPEVAQRIEEAYSDDDGVTFSRPVIVAHVNPQGEPPGYNRGRTQILNVPYIAVDKGRDDGSTSEEKEKKRGFGNVYLTYFDGETGFPAPATGFARAADIELSTSTDNGTTWGPKVKVNSDTTQTSHVFSSVQVNAHGTVFVTWIDRRVDPVRNLLNDTWAAFSDDQGHSAGGNVRVTDVSTDWLARADAQPNFGDYNSSAVIDFEKFGSIWSDGRFPPGTFVDRGRTRRAATPDSLFAVVAGGGGSSDHEGDGHDHSEKSDHDH